MACIWVNISVTAFLFSFARMEPSHAEGKGRSLINKNKCTSENGGAHL